MATKQEYLDLADRVSDLKEKRAILVAEEERKAKERKGLLEDLKAAGVDPANPKEEIARLEKEMQEEYDQAKIRVDQFEEELRTTSTPHPADVLEKVGVEVSPEVREEMDAPVSNDGNLDLE